MNNFVHARIPELLSLTTDIVHADIAPHAERVGIPSRSLPKPYRLQDLQSVLAGL